MTTITGTVKNSSNVGIAGKVVRAYRRDTGAFLGQATTSDGVTAPLPSYRSFAISSIGTVVDGDLVVLFLLVAGASAPAAPTGWTRILNTTEANGYAVAVYTSTYSASNAAANTTNFPVSNGYFLTMVMVGGGTVHQIGTLGDNTGGTVVAPALASATAAGAALVGWASSRDPGTTDITASDGMVRQMYATTMGFFDAAIFDAGGVQSGTRTFTRNATSFNFTGVLLELRSSATPAPLGSYTVDCGAYAGDAYLVMMAEASDKNSQIKDWRTAA